MPLVPAGFVNQAELDAEVSVAISQLGPEVVRVKYNVGHDFDGDPCIRFRIVLADSVARRDLIGKMSRRISNILIDQLHPYYEWGLIPYFDYRSESEQGTEPEWS